MEDAVESGRNEEELAMLLTQQCDQLINISRAIGYDSLHSQETCFLNPRFSEYLESTESESGHFTGLDGWPIELAARVKELLLEIFTDWDSDNMSVRWLREVLPDWTGRLLMTTRVVHIEPVVDEAGLVSGIALIENRPLFQASELRANSLLLALQQMDLDDHGGQSKLHLHPLDRKGGTHLGYKLVFDATQGQDWLAWEDHGDKAWKRPWGNPAVKPLPKSTSTALHTGSLAAVQADRKTVKVRMKFTEWAALFEKPSFSSYVAHPEVLKPTRFPNSASGGIR